MTSPFGGKPAPVFIRGGDAAISVISTSTSVNDFLFDVALFKVLGYETEFILGLNRNVGGVLEDLWGAGVDMVFPVAEEQWEVVSDNVNDTFGGTGANIVGISYLDGSYEDQFEIVLMNGTTPVLLPSANSFRPNRILAIVVGSNGSNVGNITCQVSPAGAPRNFMFAEFVISMDGHFTVPAGFSGLMTFCQVNAGRNDGVEFRVRRSVGTSGSFGVSLFNNIFEGVANTAFPVPLEFSEQTDVIFSALNTGVGGTADAFAVCQIVLVAE